ncbi:MAG: TrkH family potassium uptake protein [Planctomycetota bacterium]|nr:TrkH family potassium uptake protein [Planctomycetota bacterium]
MNKSLLCRLLSIVAILIGASMTFSLPWALPIFGGQWKFEQSGFWGLVAAMAVCFAVGIILRRVGRNGHGQLFQKEAMAVVGLSWVLATVLGALPYTLSGTYRTPTDRMTYVDAMFEAQSGFSTTGATVLTELEDPQLVPRCIMFWRSSTHFLGGLGIIVLFVAILGQGSAGKALMKAEMPGPSQSSAQARMQHTAWALFLVYVGLNTLLSVILMLENLSPFDALCHAFGTMATGGFSTYNASVGHFETRPDLYNAALIDYTITLFMFLAGTNFMLLYALVIFQPKRLLADIEWRVYAGIIVLVTVLVVAAGLYAHNFENSGMVPPDPATVAAADGAAGDAGAPKQTLAKGVRYGLFQVVSIMTTTGFCTDNFDVWNSFGKGIMLVLMFIGGCAGSTGGGLKVIRHILFVKILGLEAEQSFHPSVVRPLRLGGSPVEDQALRKNILVYFGLIFLIFTAGWIFTISLEPDSTWTDKGHIVEHKLIDAASCVAATLNNIGPGYGVVGPTKNYTHFHWHTKTLFIWLMMIGRLEIYVIVVLFVPGFWRSQ